MEAPIIFSRKVEIVVLALSLAANASASAGETAGPPMDPESWHVVPGTVLGQGQIWGNRVSPRATFALPGDTPEGPFELVEKDHILPGLRPVFWQGRWYSVFPGEWEGQPGFGLAWADDLFGRVTLNPKNPIIRVDNTDRTSALLFHHDGTWGVLFTGGGTWRDHLPLRLAVTDPSLLEIKKEAVAMDRAEFSSILQNALNEARRGAESLEGDRP